MDENSTLESLSQSWKQKSEQERKRLEQIEKEKLQDLSESLRESMSQELQKIENDMTARLKNLRDKMTEARQKIVADEKATLNTLRENRAEIEDEALTLFETLNKVKARYWITPLIVGLTLTIGLGLGLWGLGAVISDRSQTLQTVNEEIAQAKDTLHQFKARGMVIDQDGYLIMPRGTELQGGYTANNGKQQVYKIKGR